MLYMLALEFSWHQLATIAKLVAVEPVRRRQASLPQSLCNTHTRTSDEIGVFLVLQYVTVSF